MTNNTIGAIVLAAGKGTRMKSDLPKVLHKLAGKAMVRHVTDTVGALSPARICVVVAPGMDAVADAVAPHRTAIQAEALGTGHAALAAAAEMADFAGDVFILFGDTPLITADTLRAMLAARRSDAAPAVVVLGMRVAAANAYGRLIQAADGTLERIVEFKDATEAEKAAPLCNSGVMLVEGARLFGWLRRIGNDNKKGEYYLTDLVALARADGAGCAVVEGAEAELLGVNSRVELAMAEAVLQTRLREAAMLAGVTMPMPETVYLSADTRFGQDVYVGPHTVFMPGVSVGNGVEIKGFCHFEGARIADHAILGPYARLRPGAEIGEGAHLGNFVEIKKATVEAGAKVNHLAYIGDARVGARANIGAGTITCNYDGFDKHFTDIGADAFVGTNNALVAPVTIGDGAITAAGSVISQNVPGDALAIERARQETKPGWAAKFRDRKRRRRQERAAD
ncbi:MAG: bifunctional UDP-N-acetylglucosamine diphosphorylase/glucosamine-1-phosphate N-acetyltransferase GlmU [Alphaproteobacteria bacterium]|nr:bifunctional UDP-N-acetylglucosamine diphosphorylase/glucosamine-1-phosphate N-acetyltransferase GlmU [Alphaproteobacteria bacterium]MCB9931261.1 bifunctional UDP-N-acetylglucosamine diphosphorylase/glucosamine-1-phosphate N-acetyltransferase GlmU [Alphaproteobacteria bacterium]